MRQNHYRLKTTLIICLILLFNLLHYLFSEPLTNLHHIIFRLNYLPIVMAAFWFGWRGGFFAALLTTLVLLPDMVLLHFKFHADLNSFLEVLLYNVVGSLTGILSTAEMRQRQKYEAVVLQLARTEQMAKLGQLAASLAHEIRNPLQSILPTASMLQGDVKSESRRRELATILHEEVERLNALVNDFLQFARPKPPVMVETDLNHLVEKTVEMLQLRLAETPITVGLTLERELPAITADPEQIQQVLWNLIENAIEAVGGPAGEIQVETYRSPGGVCVSVTDSGKGISDADLPHIFEPFYSTKPQGTGLGLSICQRIIEAHHGTIQWRGNKGNGCTFTMIFPITD